VFEEERVIVISNVMEIDENAKLDDLIYFLLNLNVVGKDWVEMLEDKNFEYYFDVAEVKPIVSEMQSVYGCEVKVNANGDENYQMWDKEEDIHMEREDKDIGDMASDTQEVP